MGEKLLASVADVEFRHLTVGTMNHKDWVNTDLRKLNVSVVPGVLLTRG